MKINKFILKIFSEIKFSVCIKIFCYSLYTLSCYRKWYKVRANISYKAKTKNVWLPSVDENLQGDVKGPVSMDCVPLWCCDQIRWWWTWQHYDSAVNWLVQTWSGLNSIRELPMDTGPNTSVPVFYYYCCVPYLAKLI